MSTLEEEIRDLKEEIVDYRVKLRAATTEAGEERYANLITARGNNLTALLQQQQQGKLIIPSRPFTDRQTDGLKRGTEMSEKKKSPIPKGIPNKLTHMFIHSFILVSLLHSSCLILS